MLIVGVDPGLGGGLAFLKDGDLIEIIDMPIIKLEKNKKAISSIEVFNALRLAMSITGQSENIAALEVVHAMPKQGVTSMFTFGYGYGLVRGAIDCAGYFCEPVRPQAWKKHFGLIGKEKSAGLLVVEQFCPHLSTDCFITKRGRVIDGRIDAALIARYYWDRRKTK